MLSFTSALLLAIPPRVFLDDLIVPGRTSRWLRRLTGWWAHFPSSAPKRLPRWEVSIPHFSFTQKKLIFAAESKLLVIKSGTGRTLSSFISEENPRVR